MQSEIDVMVCDVQTYSDLSIMDFVERLRKLSAWKRLKNFEKMARGISLLIY